METEPKIEIKSAYNKGIVDANNFYKKMELPAATWTLIAGILSPFLGLIPAIACSSTPPDLQPGITVDTQRINDDEYMAGYRAQAYIIKKNKVWKNYGIGASIGLVIMIIIISSMNN